MQHVIFLCESYNCATLQLSEMMQDLTLLLTIVIIEYLLCRDILIFIVGKAGVTNNMALFYSIIFRALCLIVTLS